MENYQEICNLIYTKKGFFVVSIFSLIFKIRNFCPYFFCALKLKKGMKIKCQKEQM